MKQHVRRNHTQTRHDPAARYQWPATLYNPPSKPEPPLDLRWAGTLGLLPDRNLLGELQDMHGWTLSIVGTVQDRDNMALRSWVRTPGLILPMMDDRGLRSDLTERMDASWPWAMTRAFLDAWTGRIAGPSWTVVVSAKRVSNGRLALSGVVEAVSNG